MRRSTLCPQKRQQILLFPAITVLLSSWDSPPTAPSFSCLDLGQRNVDLTAYSGKVVVLNRRAQPAPEYVRRR
jgi:hypothetical protein